MRQPWFGQVFTLLLIIPGFAVQPSFAAEPVRGDPENILKTHGLRKSGWVYVLETEATFHSKINDARNLYQEWMPTAARLNQQEQEAQAILDLTAQSGVLKQNIGQLRQQMSRGGYGGRRGAQYRQMQNRTLMAEVNEMQSTLNQMTQQLNQLKKNVPKPKEKKSIEEEASRRRNLVQEAIVELESMADSIRERYHELHQTKEVEASLISLNRSGESKYKLGPSREHAADIKILQKLRHELGMTGTRGSGPSKSGKKQHPKTKLAI